MSEKSHKLKRKLERSVVPKEKGAWEQALEWTISEDFRIKREFLGNNRDWFEKNITTTEDLFEFYFGDAYKFVNKVNGL